MATANGAGAKLGATLSYDPNGQASATPDNSGGNLDYGWLGRYQRPWSTRPGSFPPSRRGQGPMCLVSAASSKSTPSKAAAPTITASGIRSTTSIEIGRIVLSGSGPELLANTEVRKAYLGED